jgi:glutathione synthase/RimK-type ligase-like ATP-grasp enzyme
MRSAWCLWDVEGFDWSGFDAVVVRSTWDYQHRRAEFLRWAGRVPRIFNRAELLAWNTDKRYLADLAAGGVETVPTTFADPGEKPRWPHAPEVVVKPSISAGSKDTARFAVADPAERERARALLGAIHASGRTAMIQPYVENIDERGETALVYFDGDFSHAIRKAPLLKPGEGPVEGLFAPEKIEPRAASDAERELGDGVVKMIGDHFGTPLYARVDLVPGNDGAPLLLELELTEPSLFLAHAYGAAERLTAAVAARL